MENARQGEYTGLTRYIRPVENISFTGQEMLTCLLQAVHPATLTTINQLHGDRKGVVRMTFRSEEAATDFDQRLASRKLHINGVRIAAVEEAGQFIRVTLLDVPEYLSSLDIERELRQYGSVAHVRREYIEFRGHRIENETRHVLFSHISKEIPQRIQIEGHSVFVTYRQGTLSRPREDNSNDVTRASGSVTNVYQPPRPASLQTTHAAPTTADANVQVHTVTTGTPRPERRAASPMVTPQTESLPEITAGRPRHVLASPKPYRRASLGNVSKPSDDCGRVHFRVEAQVQTDDTPRQDVTPISSGWASGYSDGQMHKQYYSDTHLRGHNDDRHSGCNCETNL